MTKIKITEKDGVKYANVNDLQGWKKNPRDISSVDFKRLTAQIELGEHSALLITSDGTVLGGNTRLKAYKQAKKDQAKVIVVDFQEEDGEVVAYVDGVKAKRTFDSIDQAYLEYALSHNDMIGTYNETKLAELLTLTPVETDIYKMSTVLRPIEDTLLEAGVGEVADRPTDESDLDDRLDTYMNGNIKQIVLYFDNDMYTQIMPKLEKLRERYGVEDNTALFLRFVEDAEAKK